MHPGALEVELGQVAALEGHALQARVAQRGEVHPAVADEDVAQQRLGAVEAGEPAAGQLDPDEGRGGRVQAGQVTARELAVEQPQAPEPRARQAFVARTDALDTLGEILDGDAGRRAIRRQARRQRLTCRRRHAGPGTS